jgi:hypothetical protein
MSAEPIISMPSGNSNDPRIIQMGLLARDNSAGLPDVARGGEPLIGVALIASIAAAQLSLRDTPDRPKSDFIDSRRKNSKLSVISIIVAKTILSAVPASSWRVGSRESWRGLSLPASNPRTPWSFPGGTRHCSLCYVG